MSAIDQYKHICLGYTECPSTFNFVGNNPTRRMAIYQLLEDIPDDETNFDGKAGDLILGGGSGEAPAFRISIPEAMLYFTQDGWDKFDMLKDIYYAFWTPNQSYILCEGFSKLGWTPDVSIEHWLAKNICLLLIEDVEEFSVFRNQSPEKSELPYWGVS